jgi:hypothetical protein
VYYITGYIGTAKQLLLLPIILKDIIINIEYSHIENGIAIHVYIFPLEMLFYATAPPLLI